MSIYAEYMKEREGISVIESEYGFISYKALPSEQEPKEYRVFDLYVSPGLRRSGLATEMANQVVSIARKNGCKIMTGSVNTATFCATTSAKVLLAYGFKILRTEGHMIHFVKEIS